MNLFAGAAWDKVLSVNRGAISVERCWCATLGVESLALPDMKCGVDCALKKYVPQHAVCNKDEANTWSCRNKDKVYLPTRLL